MNALRAVERVLLVVGLFFLAIYAGAYLHRLLLSRIAVRAMAQTVRPVSKLQSADNIDFSLWSEKRIAAFEESLSKKLEPPIAVLLVPRIALEVPVFEGTDELTLNRGTGHIVGTAHPGEEGNIGISGHRDGFFRGLKDVRLGDSVVLTTTEGSFPYVVDNIEIVNPDEVRVLRTRAVPAITLTTCYPFYFIGAAPQRYVVQGSLQGQAASNTFISNQRKPNANSRPINHEENTQ